MGWRAPDQVAGERIAGGGCVRGRAAGPDQKGAQGVGVGRSGQGRPCGADLDRGGREEPRAAKA